MRSASVFLLLSLLLPFAQKIHAEELVVGINMVGNPPLIFPHGHHKQGIYKEILQAVAKLSGHQLSYRYLPPKRLMFAFDKGTIDIEPGINPAWRSKAKIPGLYTKAFAISENIVLFAPGKKRIVRRPMDLLGGEVGTIVGYSYPGYMKLFAQGRIKRHDGNSEYNLMTRMNDGRLNQIFIQKDVAAYWMSQEPKFKAFEIGNVNFKDSIMLRLHPSKRHILDSLNRALAQLQKSKEIEAIYQKYR